MKTYLLAVTLFAAACGNNNNTSPDAPAGSGSGIDAGSGGSGSGSGSGSSGPRAVAVGAVFSTPPGVISSLDVDTQTVHENLIADAVSSDPQLRRFGDTLYLINRASPANLTLIDADALTLISQIATGSNSDPWDVAVVGDKLYLPDELGSGVIELSASGQSITKTIALGSAVGDPDGDPNCTSVYAVGSDVYVACDRLDSSYTPEGSGVVVVIDSATDTVRTVFTLPVPNPQSVFEPLPNGDLLIAAEAFSDDTAEAAGCIVDITPGATPTSKCLINNSDLNGIASHVETAPNGDVWIAVSMFDSPYTGSLSKWDGTTLTNNISGSNESITDLAACSDGTIVAGDQTAPGLRIFSGSGVETTTAALPYGDPPVDGNGIVCYTP